MTAGEVRISVDRSKCRSYENCLDAAPDYFDLDDEGIAIVNSEPENGYEYAVAQRAARLCPVRAITAELVIDGESPERSIP